MNEENEKQKRMDLSDTRSGRDCTGRLYRKPVSFKFYELWTDLWADEPSYPGFRNPEYHLCTDNQNYNRKHTGDSGCIADLPHSISCKAGIKRLLRVHTGGGTREERSEYVKKRGK